MITHPNQNEEDIGLDITLRPQGLKDYQGQEKTKENLRILIAAARLRNESPEHILICGPAGLGKTTLAYIIAKEMGVGIKITSGPAIERAGDLGSILTNLVDGDILFVDEIHRLNKIVEEVLYPAMEDFKLDIVIGKGPSARTLQLDLPRFTLVSATTRPGLISSPLRSRFGATFRLDFYKQEDIEKIISRSARILNIPIDQKAIMLIARSARATPRVANRLLKRVRDFAQVRGDGQVDEELARAALNTLEIDEWGLEPADRQILRQIIEKFNGGPVGLQSLAAVVNEEQDTIEDIYEPYLMQLGFIGRTPRGALPLPWPTNTLKSNCLRNPKKKLL